MNTSNPDPIPLNDRDPKLHLPMKLLPPLLKDLVTALSWQYQIDSVIPLATALGCIATATRGKVKTKIHSQRIEHSSFYICSLAISGDRKSTVMNWLRKPLDDYEMQLQQDEKMRFALQQAEYEISEAKLKAIKESLSNPKKSKPLSSPASQADLIAAIAEVAENKPEPIPEIVCGGDVTNDRLTEMLQMHKSLGILEAEGTIFAHLSGKRHNTGSAYETMLSAFTGDPIKSHRIGRSDGVVVDAHLVICTSVQPKVWHDLTSDDAAIGRGVIGRFIVLAAESNIGYRDTEADLKYPMPDDLFPRWQKMIKQLLDTTNPRNIELTAEGNKMLRDWDADWELHLQDYDNHLDGLGSRMPGQIIKIATLYTLSENPGALHIDDLCLEQAINLADFLLAHRKRADDQSKSVRSPEQKILDKIAPWMRQHFGAVGAVIDAFSFTERDLQQNIKNQAWAKEGGMKAIAEALKNLNNKGYLEIENDRWYPRADLLSHRW